MSAYEQLVERSAREIWLSEALRVGQRRLTDWADESEDTHNQYRPLARAVLSQVLRTLETVTPEMAAAAEHQVDSLRCDEQVESECYLAMLRASALSPP